MPAWLLPAAIGGSALIGAASSYFGSRDQEDAAGRAARQAAEAQLEMFYQNREDSAPWRDAGMRDLENLERIEGIYEGAIMDPSQYKESPGYEWLRQQGIEAINRAASGRGTLHSGKTSKDLVSYGQGLALQDYGGYLGRLKSLMNRYAATSNVGQTTSMTLAQMGQNAAGNAGYYRAAGTIGQANARTGLYNNLSNIGSNAVNQYMLYNQMNQSAPPATGAVGGGGIFV